MHCNSITAHQKALQEAVERLEELKASGLKHVNTSQLELAIAETRDRINVSNCANLDIMTLNIKSCVNAPDR